MKKLKALFLTAVIALCGCAAKGETYTITNNVDLDAVPADMTVYEWIDGEIGDFQEITFSKALRLFKEKGSGILYFGYDDCPFCERGVPVLNEAVRETGVTVYYIDVYGPFQPTAEEYEELMGYIEEYMIEDSKGNKSFFVPWVIGVKNGGVTASHVSLVSDFSIENEESQMNDSQKKELKEIYLDIIRKTAD